MKQIVIYISELVLCALVVCFCLKSIFLGEGNVGSILGNMTSQMQLKENVTENDLRLKQVLEMPRAEIRLSEGGFSIGERISFLSRIEIRQGELWVPLEDVEDYNLEILDITDSFGNSVWDTFVAEGNTLSERGRYQATVRLQNAYGRTEEKEITFYME